MDWLFDWTILEHLWEYVRMTNNFDSIREQNKKKEFREFINAFNLIYGGNDQVKSRNLSLLLRINID